ncbi:M14 family metallopeptidase [Polaribacter sp. Asnod1-A03]|uniref:M14 family metallopeptidase n=1 Tax=Polaribacter sp. Asnod1-A03 TaxID=3160581 RepID=UPI00386DD91C
MKETLLFLFFSFLFFSCKTTEKATKWKGQPPVKAVSTNTKPTQKQYKDVFNLGDNIYVTNNFDGARLNGITRINDTLISTLITPENTPINTSPWYAFKIWSKKPTNIYINLTYLNNVKHRYHPKTSIDGKNWNPIEPINYQLIRTDTTSKSAKIAQLKLAINADTLWVAAQEVINSTDNKNWIQTLVKKPFIKSKSIGFSKEKRTIEALEIGKGSNKKMIAVISRQHPPEVTGYLAMKSFVETIASDTDLAKNFREQFSTYVVPMVNPDGVDNGHWRHNVGGIDLNRDWSNKNQPEINVVENYYNSLTKNEKKIYFFVDFHSTYHDIFYTVNPALKSNATGVVPKMIQQMGEELNLDPNIKPSDNINSVISTRYFFNTFNAESLTYEIGDDTPRDLLKKKGEVSAIKLMQLLLEQN